MLRGRCREKKSEGVQTMQDPDGGESTLYNSRGVSRNLSSPRGRGTDLFGFCQVSESQIFGSLLLMGVNMAKVSVRGVRI